MTETDTDRAIALELQELRTRVEGRIRAIAEEEGRMERGEIRAGSPVIFSRFSFDY